jgi:tetratricopeptide (TPR) repeat protein
MNNWIYYVQKYITSGFTDRNSLCSATSICADEDIQLFLELIDIDKHECIFQGLALSKQLEAKGKENESVIVSLLSNIPFLAAIEKPLEVSIEFRNSAYAFLDKIKLRLKRLKKLKPTTAFISNISASGFFQIKDFIAAQNAFKEALKIRRELAVKEPEIYRSAIASTLGNLGILQFNRRDFSEAKKSYEESLKIKREFSTIYSVALTLTNLGNVLLKLGEYTAAKEAFEESLEISRELSLDNMGRYKALIGQNLNSLGNLLCYLRDFSTAKGIYEEANEIFHELVLKDSKYKKTLSMILDNHGVLLRSFSEFSKARKVFDESLEIKRELVLKDPDVYKAGIANTLNHIGNLSRHIKDFPAARKAFEEALAIRRELVIKEPDIYKPDIAIILNNLSNLFEGSKDIQSFSARRIALEEARDIYLDLALKEPDVYRSNITGVLNNIGNLERDLLDSHAANEAYEEAIRRAEIIPDNSRPIHLVKGPILDSYHYLLHTKATNSIDAFSLSVAIRNRTTRSHEIGKEVLDELQLLLKSKDKNSNTLSFLLLPTSAHNHWLTLGLISAENAVFYTIDASNWNELIPQDMANADNIKRQFLAHSIWEELPKEVQQALRPSINVKKSIIIGGDPFWTAFPWELLCFGEGDEDYLGLHYALPRVGSILPRDIDAQLGVKAIGTGRGIVSVIAPHDTGLSPLQGVLEEIEAIRLQVDNFHGEIKTFVKGSQASEEVLVKAINEQPDILYYTGHGTIVQNEEVLVLNTDLSVKNPFSATTLFGNHQLNILGNEKSELLFTHSPLIVLNCCNTGRIRNYGGDREDLVSTFLNHGAGAVIATALPIHDVVGKVFSKALFSRGIVNMQSIGDQVVEVRRSMATGLCRDTKESFWGAWGMIHIHGSSDANVPFRIQ